MSIRRYIKEKIKLLEDFSVPLTESQKEHVRRLKTEIAVDNFAKSLMERQLDGVEIRESLSRRRGE